MYECIHMSIFTWAYAYSGLFWDCMGIYMSKGLSSLFLGVRLFHGLCEKSRQSLCKDWRRNGLILVRD